MYAFVDRPVECLCNGGRFLLWAMRGWAQAVERGTCPTMALARGFTGLGAMAMLPDFHIAMALLNRDGRDKIAVAPMKCLHIVEDEAILIGIWRDLSLGDIDRARATLKLMVSDDAVMPISRTMITATAKLLLAGFDLSGLPHAVSGS
ncbi:MAG: hypothetical protein ACOY4P_05295 [Pseudomonadota bacterium]|jgi:hypothetical protein|tara:strand:- start:4173 stop:4616 length:444 start_codon:yes stop_codon:yes gene_type:complete